MKIDGAFVRNIENDPIDLAMVKSISDIVRKMGIKTTAECVENVESLQLLKEVGVDYVQGYYLGKPKPLDQFLSSQTSLTSNVVHMKGEKH